MIRISLLAGVALSLAACCTTPEPEVRTVTVQVPTPVTCVPASVDTSPEFRVGVADVGKAAEPAERLRLAAAGFLEREAWITGQALPALRGCKD